MMLEKGLHVRLKERLEKVDNLNSWLTKWDKGSKHVRKSMLVAFLDQNRDKQGKEIADFYGDSMSLLLSRFSSCLRLTYLVGFGLSYVIQAIHLVIRATEDAGLREEFLESGCLITLMEIVAMTADRGVMKRDKIAALELLIDLAQFGSLQKKMITEYLGIDAIRECILQTDDEEIHQCAQQLLELLGINNPEYASGIVRLLGVLIRNPEPMPKLTSCIVLRKLLVNKQSAFYHIPRTKGEDEKPDHKKQDIINMEKQQEDRPMDDDMSLDHALDFIRPATNLLQSSEVLLQGQGIQVIKSLLTIEGLYSKVAKDLIRSLYELPWMSANGNSAGGASIGNRRNSAMMDKHGPVSPAICILRIFDELIRSGTTSMLSILCNAGVVTMLVGSMLNVHDYEVQKMSIKICRELCCRFEPVIADLKELMGDEIVEKILTQSSLNDGRIVRELIRNEDLFNAIAEELKDRDWDIGFHGNDKHKHTNSDSDSSSEPDHNSVPPVQEEYDDPATAEQEEIEEEEVGEDHVQNDDKPQQSTPEKGKEELRASNGEEEVGREREEVHNDSKENRDDDDDDEEEDDEDEDEEEEEENDEKLDEDDTNFLRRIDVMKSGDRKQTEEEIQKQQQRKVFLFPLSTQDLQLRVKKKFGVAFDRDGSISSTLDASNSTTSISKGAQPPMDKQPSVLSPRAMKTQHRSSKKLNQIEDRILGKRLEQMDVEDEDQQDTHMKRKEEIYIPVKRPNPKMMDSSVRYSQFIMQDKTVFRSEDKETLDYIKGLPVTDCGENNGSLEKRQIKPSLLTLLNEAEADVIREIPFIFLPESVAPSYILNAVNPDHDKKSGAGLHHRNQNHRNVETKEYLTKEKRIALREQRAREIKEAKANLRADRIRRFSGSAPVPGLPNVDKNNDNNNQEEKSDFSYEKLLDLAKAKEARKALLEKQKKQREEEMELEKQRSEEERLAALEKPQNKKKKVKRRGSVAKAS